MRPVAFVLLFVVADSAGLEPRAIFEGGAAGAAGLKPCDTFEGGAAGPAGLKRCATFDGGTASTIEGGVARHPSTIALPSRASGRPERVEGRGALTLRHAQGHPEPGRGVSEVEWQGCGLNDAPVTREQIEAFMRTAKVVRFRELSTGITRPLRLTLSDGETTHDALFQKVDQRKTLFQPQTGPAEVNFVDSWRYNMAAYRLSLLLGLEHMMPVTIEYTYRGTTGALSWWMDSPMDERERMKKKIPPRNPNVWNQDMHRLRVFTELVRDTDRNLGNVLVSPEWRVLMVDFTRAFRLHDEIRPAELQRCDRQLLARMEGLTAEAVRSSVENYLTGTEIEAVMKRRDRIVSHVRSLAAKLGEEKVLY